MPEESLGQSADGQLVITTPLLSKLDAIQREQAAGFAGVREALNGKADKADVARVETRMEGQFQEHHRRLVDLETASRERVIADTVRKEDHTQVLTQRQKFWGAVGVTALVLASLAAPVVSHFLNFK